MEWKKSAPNNGFCNRHVPFHRKKRIKTLKRRLGLVGRTCSFNYSLLLLLLFFFFFFFAVPNKSQDRSCISHLSSQVLTELYQENSSCISHINSSSLQSSAFCCNSRSMIFWRSQNPRRLLPKELGPAAVGVSLETKITGQYKNCSNTQVMQQKHLKLQNTTAEKIQANFWKGTSLLKVCFV